MIEGLPAGVTTPTAAILTLLLASFATNLWALRAVFTGLLVPRRHHDEVVGRLLAEIETAHERVEKADRESADSLALAQSMTEMNVELVKQKDAARAAVESVKALAERRAGEET